MSNKKRISILLVILAVFIFLFCFRWEIKDAEQVLYQVEMEISPDSIQLQNLADQGITIPDQQRIIIYAEVRRRCYRDLIGRKWGTYYPLAKSYWEYTRKPFVGKYIRVEHSMYGNKRLDNVAEITHYGGQRRHCRAHHLKAYFNLFGDKEYLQEIGQN